MVIIIINIFFWWVVGLTQKRESPIIVDSADVHITDMYVCACRTKKIQMPATLIWSLIIRILMFM